MEIINLGILGDYSLEDVVCDSDFDTDEEYFTFIRDVLKKYNDNIELIDRKLLYRIYNELSACGFPIWEEDNFDKIIDEDKLPKGFNSMSDEEKKKLFYDFEITEDNIKDAILNNIPFFNIGKLKNDIRVHNVNINEKYNEISIEFDGICDFFSAMVTFKYDDSFRISEFHAA